MNALKRVDDTGHRAEQSDERGRGADGGQTAQAATTSGGQQANAITTTAAGQAQAQAAAGQLTGAGTLGASTGINNALLANALLGQTQGGSTLGAPGGFSSYGNTAGTGVVGGYYTGGVG